MALGDQIRSDLDQMVGKPWSIRDGNVVPGTDDVGLYSNDAVKLDAVYLYADLQGSTKLARDFTPQVAGKVIRASLRTASTIIKKHGGECFRRAVLAPLRRVVLASLLGRMGEWSVRSAGGTDCSGPTLDRVRFPGCPGTEPARVCWPGLVAVACGSRRPPDRFP